METWNRRRVLGAMAASGVATAASGVVGIRTADAAKDKAARLNSILCGDILFPGDKDYDAERAGWNLTVEHHPAVIVVAACERDVRWAVRIASWFSIPVAVQATGHGAAVPADGAMLINTRRLDDLTIDGRRRTATIGAGVKWQPVLEAAGARGLAPLVGSTPDLSATGYTSGGGLPVLGRQFGFAVDHVRAINMITMDGRRRKLSPKHEHDLFWAVRGGRGNFGVVTSIETDLMPLARLYGGGLFFDGSVAKQVLSAYLRWTADQPEEMSSSIALINGLLPPDLAPPTEPMVHVRIAYTGTASEGARLLQPLRELGPLQDTMADMPYTEMASIHNDPLEPTPVWERSALVRRLDDAAVRQVVELAGPGADAPPSILEIRHMGGALARTPERPSAIGHRGAAMLFNSLVALPPDDRDTARQYHDRVFDSIEPWNTGGAFPNFLGYTDTTPDEVQDCYEPADYQKLRQLKAKYDPRNLLRINFNIPPG